MKFIICFMCMALLLVGCSKNKIDDSVKCSDIGKELTDSLDDDQNYLEFDDAHRMLHFDDGEHYDDFYHVYSEDTGDISEIGIFHAPNSDHADDLLEDCREYVEELREGSRSFVASYAPNELTKLDGADVKRIGNYVVYTVLPTEKTEAVFDKLESKLKK